MHGVLGMGGATEAPDLMLLGPQLVVAGFSTHMEVLRAHEIANEVRRVKKQLKDCQQLAALYNNRERIFGLPTTSVGLLWCTRPLGLRKGPSIYGHIQTLGGRALAFEESGLNRLQRENPPLALRARSLAGTDRRLARQCRLCSATLSPEPMWGRQKRGQA